MEGARFAARALSARTSLAFVVALAAFLTAEPGKSAADPVSDYKRAVEASFAQWLQGLWPEAEASGVSRATFDQQLKGLKLDWSLPQLVPPDPAYPGGPALPAAMKPKPQPQAEFGVPEHYFNARSLNALANGGRAQYRQLAPTLQAIEKQYGVPASIVIAIWGRETAFGQAALPYDAVSAIATQAFKGGARTSSAATDRCTQDHRSEHATRQMLKSSWAGAMGHTQFLPQDFEDHAVDFDGDGRRDIWRPVLTAWPGAANSLHHKGWTTSSLGPTKLRCRRISWDCTLQGPDQALPISEWIGLGVQRVSGRPFPKERLGDLDVSGAPGRDEGTGLFGDHQFLRAEALQQLGRLRDFRWPRGRHD